MKKEEDMEWWNTFDDHRTKKQHRIKELDDDDDEIMNEKKWT